TDSKGGNADVLPARPPTDSKGGSADVLPARPPGDAGAERDGGKPKLKELKGRGVLVRRMVRGFYLALDRDFKAAGARWWRTTFGFAVPFERVGVQTGVTKHTGAWFTPSPLATLLDAGEDDAGSVTAEMPAFIASGYAHKIDVEVSQKKIVVGA